METNLATFGNLATSESTFQAKCFQWSWNYMPETRNLICYNLNNSKNRIDGARNKAMGLIKGRSDMVFYWNGESYMIELKQPGQKQTKEQIKWQRLIQSQGFNYHLIDSFEAFQSLVRAIVTNNPSKDKA